MCFGSVGRYVCLSNYSSSAFVINIKKIAFLIVSVISQCCCSDCQNVVDLKS